jgi:hypothetical protein
MKLAGQNPWVTAQEPAALPALVPRGRPSRVTGPALPQPASVEPPEEGGLQIAEIPPRFWLPPQSGWWWAGCHGGAGVTTLMNVIDGGHDAGRAWPARMNEDTHVVLVARTHEHGLRMAQAAARQWASGTLPPDIRLLGLVLVPDSAGKRPRALRDLADLISGGVPRTWELGWHEEFRLGVFAGPGSGPRDYRQLASDLSTIVATGGTSA